jgi:hypothetical protein
MADNTAMQQLKDKLQVVVADLKDAVSGTDQYGYRSAMENVIKGIDAQMLETERQQIIDARISVTGLNHASPTDDNSLEDAEQYYSNKYGSL